MELFGGIHRIQDVFFDFDKFHVPRRLMRTYKSGKFEMKVNSAWREVLKACADRDSTWITDDIFRVYTEMHEAGFAHSVEAYYEGKLGRGALWCQHRRCLHG